MKKNLTFLLSFSVAKGIVFFAPLFLADILSDSDYGLLEYSLAGVGMILNAFLDLGVSGAYPYFILREKRLNIKNGFLLHPIWLLLTFIINQFLFFGFNLYTIEFYLALNVSYIIANQVFYSTQFKSHEKPIQAVFLDAGVYIVLLIFGIGFITKLLNPTIENISIGITLYAILLAMFGTYNFIKAKKDKLYKKYKDIITFSIHLLFSSIFLFSLTVAGRILSKEFFGFEATGIYGFYYRISAIVVMVYQVITIRFFKEIYTLKPKTLDTKFALFYIFIFSISVLIYFVSPYILPSFSNFFSETYKENSTLWFIIFCQMTMWISSALHSNIIDREGLAKKNNLFFLGLFITAISLLYFAKDKLSLLSLTFILYSIYFIANLLQIVTLYTKEIRFKKSLIALSAIYITSIIIMYFLIN